MKRTWGDIRPGDVLMPPIFDIEVMSKTYIVDAWMCLAVNEFDEDHVSVTFLTLWGDDRAITCEPRLKSLEIMNTVWARP